MNRWVKRIVIVIIAFIALVMTGVFVITHYIDPNAYKNKISAVVEKATGRSFAINGNLGWSFFPGLGLTAHDVVMGNAPGFGDKPYATMKEMNMSVNLLALLQRRIQAGNFVVKGLELNLMKNAQGQNNWSDVLQHAQKKSSATPSTIVATGVAAESAANIASIELDNAKITWNDIQKNQHWELSRLNVRAKNIEENQAFPLHIDSDLKSASAGISGVFSVKGSVTFNLQDQTVLLQPLQIESQWREKARGSEAVDVKGTAKIALNLKQQTMSVSGLNAQIANLHLLGSLQATRLFEAFSYQGKIQIPAFNLKQWLVAVGQLVPKMSASALQTASAIIQVKGDPQTIVLNVTSANIDDMHLLASVVKQHQGNTSVSVALNRIDLNRYLSSSTDAPLLITQAQYKGTIFPSTQTAGKKTLLQTLHSSGRLMMATFAAKKIQANNVSMSVNTQSGVMSFTGMSAQLYQGQYNGNVQVNMTGAVPQIVGNHQFSKIQIEPLLNDLHDIAPIKMTGTADLTSTLSMRGDTAAAIRQSLNGSVKFAVHQGTLKGVDVAYFLALGRSLLHKELAVNVSNTGETPFTSLTGTATIAQGVVQNNDLVLQAPVMRVLGQGSFNLVKESVDYRLRAMKMNTDTHQPQQDIIPIKLTGTFSDLKIRPDVEAAAKIQLQKVIKDQHLQEKLTEQIDKHVGKQIGEQLKKLNLDQLFQ